MKKSIIKILTCFIAGATFVAVTLLCLNFFGFALLASDQTNGQRTPKRTLERINEQMDSLDESFFKERGIWSILIDENGNIIWERNKPEEIPEHYSINDIAKMTRWFLNDYPVYVQTRKDGLLVLGYAKNSLGKYFIEYSMDWFNTLPQRILFIFLLNVVIALALAAVTGILFYRSLKRMVEGIQNLRYEKKVALKEKGIFKEVSENINETSKILQRKNKALHTKDEARNHWIAGISHDIRTPLSVILGYADELVSEETASEAAKEKARVISAQTIKIKRLVEDLNLISSLEYDMQPSRKKNVKICVVLRKVISDILNSGVLEVFKIQFEARQEGAMVLGDEALLERAFFNLIHNSIIHNPKGCRILVCQEISKDGQCRIKIQDDGTGVEESVLQQLDKMPQAAHGLGLPMAYRIIHVHGGTFSCRNDGGFVVEIMLPAVL